MLCQNSNQCVKITLISEKVMFLQNLTVEITLIILFQYFSQRVHITLQSIEIETTPT
jgi:hypothetical protein